MSSLRIVRSSVTIGCAALALASCGDDAPTKQQDASEATAGPGAGSGASSAGGAFSSGNGGDASVGGGPAAASGGSGGVSTGGAGGSSRATGGSGSGGGAQLAQLVGYGSITAGGAQPNGDTCSVTSLADAGPGSLRDCVVNRSGPRVVTFAIGGDIVLMTPLKVKAPYLTIDGMTAPAPGITIWQPDETTNGLGFGATHDIVVLGLRFSGYWSVGSPASGAPNSAVLSFDGDAKPDVPAWDPEPGESAVRRLVMDRCAIRHGASSAPDLWGGIVDVTFSRSLVYESYRPTEVSWEQPATDRDGAHARRRITFWRNVYARNGERQPRLHRGVWEVDFVNNVVHDWRDYASLAGKQPGGHGLSFGHEGVVDDVNVESSAFLVGDATYRPDWGCVFGADPDPEDDDDAVTDGALYFSDNSYPSGHKPNNCMSTPSTNGQPYAVPVYAQVPKVLVAQLGAALADVGPPHLDAVEQQILAEVIAKLP